MNIVYFGITIKNLTDPDISIQSGRNDSSYERKNVSYQQVSECFELVNGLRSSPRVCQAKTLTPWKARGNVNCPWKACVEIYMNVQKGKGRLWLTYTNTP